MFKVSFQFIKKKKLKNNFPIFITRIKFMKFQTFVFAFDKF